MNKDIPFDECCKRAELAVQAGFDTYQKFTCHHCKARQTIQDLNHFHTFGICEECDSVTDLKKQGCGFMAIIAIPHV